MISAPQLETIWSSLEEKLEERPGRTSRRILPDSAGALDLAVTNPGHVRSFTLTVPSEAAASVTEVPEAAGLDSAIMPGPPGGTTTLQLAVTDSGGRDVFAVLAADVVNFLSDLPDPQSAVAGWLARITRWQTLLRKARRGLSEERQRGLYAELHVLCENLTDAHGIDRAVAGWTGPTGSVHDYQFPGGHLEVKSSISGQPQQARISSERQLDDGGLPGLWLTHLSLSVSRESGESLPEIVDRARALAAESPTESRLADLLLDAGYLDLHAPRYRLSRYILREQLTFRITSASPRLIEADLPNGVGAVSYVISIPACMGSAVDTSSMVAALGIVT